MVATLWTLLSRTTRQQVFHVGRSEGEKLAAAFSGKGETYRRLSVLIARRLCAAKSLPVTAGMRETKYHALRAVRVGLARHQHGILAA